MGPKSDWGLTGNDRYDCHEGFESVVLDLSLPSEESSFKGYEIVRTSKRAPQLNMLYSIFASFMVYRHFIYQIARTLTFVISTMTLHYTENGIKATVVYVQIVPWLLSRTGVSNKIYTAVDLAQRSESYSRYPT